MDHRRTSHLIGLICVLCLLLAVGRAAAQPGPREPIDGERFKPAVTHDGFLTAEGSAVRPNSDRLAFGLFFNYALNPLVTINENDEIVDRFISHRVGADVIGSVTIWEPFAIGLDLPFYFVQLGDEDPDMAGLGDLRIVPKVRLLDEREVFGLAVAAEVRAPTHTGDFSGGARNVVFVPRLIADYRFGFGLRLGANAGAALREGTEFENVNAASEFVYAAALSYRIGGLAGPVAIGAEVNGGVGLTSIDFEELPLEGAVYAKINPTPEWEIQLGPGAGIIPGYGIPTFRAFLGVRFTPISNDKDGDGIPDDVDACPTVPENRNGVEDSDGCPEAEPEAPDDDQDGIPNVNDQCPGEKETINGIQDEDGCPDGGPAKVIRKAGKLVILENVEFATGSAVIAGRSYSILNQVALVLKANPDIKKLRIEGHTDSRGSRDMNIKLSDARARAVKIYLINQGIKPERLSSQGFGPDRPLVEEKTPADMQKNRRVEFIIE